jgi:hypothetical protein
MRETLLNSWKRHTLVWWFGLCAPVALTFAIAMILAGGFLTNVGFLVIGGLITVMTGLINDKIKRPSQTRDLARALYVELAERVARCCFDCEAPWNKYLNPNNYALGAMDSFRLRKFSPIQPIIYTSTAGQLAMLEGKSPQALIQFYYRLAAWQRDIENIAAESQIAPDAIRLLAIRVHQTLTPGLRALEALAPMVDGYEEIEAAAIAGYDEFRGSAPTEASLRKRINKLIS